MAQRDTPRNTSRPGPRAINAEYHDAEDRILDRLDIEQELTDLGIEFVNRSASAKGWRECRAIDREEKGEPGSAAVWVKGTGRERGKYSDRGGNNLNFGSFWELAAYLNKRFRDWRDARRHYAAKTGVALPNDSGYAVAPVKMPPARPRKPAAPIEYLRNDLTRFVEAMHADSLASGRLDILAAQWGVHRDGLIAGRVGVPAAGTRQELILGPGSALSPECQVVGLTHPTPMGLQRRATDAHRKAFPRQDKRVVPAFPEDNSELARPRGIYFMHGYDVFARDTGHLFIPEGMTDSAALHSIALAATGLPSADTGFDHVVALVLADLEAGNLPADLRIVCLMDRDWRGAGLRSATALAQKLADATGLTTATRYAPSIIQRVAYWLAPGGFILDTQQPKDAREWLRLACPTIGGQRLEVRQAFGRRFIDDGVDHKTFTPQPKAEPAVVSESGTGDAAAPVEGG